MDTDTSGRQESPARDERITGPHVGYDREGNPDHYYWRCERCGLESTDPRIREGCFRCSKSPDDA